MTDDLPTNTRSGSTTWRLRKVKVRGPRPDGPTVAAGGRRWSGVSRRDAKAPLTITVRYRGGNEAWWFIEARGRRGAFPGHMCIHDVMAEINRDWCPPS